MTALARSCRAMSSTRARAWLASASSSVSTRYLPARTSVTDSKPSACSPPLIVRPAGSLTTGLSVTKTSARYLMAAPLRSGRPGVALPPGNARWSPRRPRGEWRGGRLLVPAQVLEIVAQVLLVERRLRPSRFIAFEIPETRGIRGHDLIDKDDLTVVKPEFELRVSEDQPTLHRPRSAELIEGEACLLEGLRELLTGPPGQLSARDILVMPSEGFCGRGEDRFGEAVTLLQAGREPGTRDRPGAPGVFPTPPRDV